MASLLPYVYVKDIRKFDLKPQHKHAESVSEDGTQVQSIYIGMSVLYCQKKGPYRVLLLAPQ